MANPNARRRDKLSTFQAIVGTVILLSLYAAFIESDDTEAKTSLLSIALVLLLLGTLVGQWRVGSRIARLRMLHLEMEGDFLRQFEASGQRVAVVDLSKPFDYQEVYRERGEAVYRLRQAGKSLSFHTSDPLAERVVKDLLGRPWPPPARRWYYG